VVGVLFLTNIKNDGNSIDNKKTTSLAFVEYSPPEHSGRLLKKGGELVHSFNVYHWKKVPSFFLRRGGFALGGDL
jgi:hypothetical protein